MRLPKGTIFVCVVLSFCILVLGAGAGAAAVPVSGTSAPGWQFGAQQGSAAGSDRHGSPGSPGPGNMTFADNRTPGNFENATMPFNGTPPGPGTMTRMDNRTQTDFGNGTRQFDGSYRLHGNMTSADNRTPGNFENATMLFNGTPPGPGTMTRMDNRTQTDFGNSTLPFNGTVPGDGDAPGQGLAGGDNGLNTGQRSLVDDLIEALTRFFQKSS